MKDEYRHEILTINSGSSSIKFSLYRMEQEETPILRGEIAGIGLASGRMHAKDVDSKSLIEKRYDLPDHGAALKVLLEWLHKQTLDRDLIGVGHRVVHGGIRYSKPERITSGLLPELRRLSPFAPEHLPHELNAIEAMCKHYPKLPQVACFDTMFHRQMPHVAQLYPLPKKLRDLGILHYGFHGLSYEYIMEALKREAGEETARGCILIAHLGHGASMAAVDRGRCLDTTMGFTPAGGLVMSSRSGDLDPGVMLYLLEQKGMAPRELNELLNRRSGLLGVSETTGDMKELLTREEKDPRAKDAVDLFCYQARKSLGGLAAILGGLDTLVFTGGIGENAAEVRRRICLGMAFLGIGLDPERNGAHAAVISTDSSPVTVRVIATNEELMIARHTYHLLCQVQE